LGNAALPDQHADAGDGVALGLPARRRGRPAGRRNPVMV